MSSRSAATLDVPLSELVGDLAARSARLVAVCADIRDPGNAGTVVRCADAAGAAGVVLAGDSVDVHNGKAVRASAGSVFHLPIAVHRDPADAVAALQRAGFTVLAADGAGERDLDEAEDDGLLDAPTAWLFGNEARGLPDDLGALADHRVRIPIHGRAESLNLATAAAVCLYASARAQRAPADPPQPGSRPGYPDRHGPSVHAVERRPSRRPRRPRRQRRRCRRCGTRSTPCPTALLVADADGPWSRGQRRRPHPAGRAAAWSAAPWSR